LCSGRQRAFSLLELLVVVAIIMVITTLYWGSGSASQQKAKQEVCRKNLQKIFIALQIYAQEQHDKFPVTAGARTSEEALDCLVPRYTADTTIFTCPGSSDADLPSGESIRKRTISYAYYMGRLSTDGQEALMSDRQVDTLAKSAGQNVFSTNGKRPGSNHGKYGGVFLFCDGASQIVPATLPFGVSLPSGVVLLNPR
jgi:prepilin-type N-terminal cleavage/methylation domain-containing protein